MVITMALENRCVDYFQGNALPRPAFASFSDNLLMVATLLTVKGHSYAVLRESRDHEREALYGYHVVDFLLRASHVVPLMSLLYEPILNAKDLARSVLPTIRLENTWKTALAKIAGNRFGGVLVVDSGENPVGVLSIETMLRVMEGRSKFIDLHLHEVSSLITLSTNEASALDIFRTMVSNRTRRVVTKESGKFYCCTEREIMWFLFSPERIELLRERKDGLEDILSASIKEILVPLKSVSGDMDVARAWTAAIENPLLTLIVDDERIATPWDLVIKPFLAGKIASK